jgi:formamidopyrimidine-DNA glycosylase
LPELPEVECIVRDLRLCVTGKKIMGLEFFFERMLGGVTPQEFAGRICGRVIQQVKRRGKYILFFLSGNNVLEVHLRMTGRFFFYPATVKPGKYTGVIFYLSGNAQLHFQDIRKFATFRLWEEKELCKSVPFRSGPDPLEDDFDLESFLGIMEKKPNGKIKAFLLDQNNFVGMGNIYTDEALFRAEIHPARKTGSLSAQEKKRLFEAVCSILQEGIAFRGTSFSDYRDLRGFQGEFQNRLKVYRRGGEACLRCGGTIERKVIAGRGTYFCPYCQYDNEN